jgi:coenzyme F420-reducing hydrogenase delta subunit
MTLKLQDLKSAHDQNFKDKPFLVAFCCARSAKTAKEMAFAMGHSLPQGIGMIDVPCAGSISTAHLLSAFQCQADGVLILTCHPDNCHSENGNRLAHQRVDYLKQQLSALGISERIKVATLAANMGADFHQLVGRFEQSLGE